MDELLAEGATVASLYYFPWWACHGSVPNQLPRPIKSLLGGRNQREKKYQREREKKKKKNSVPAQSWALVCFLPLALAKKAILASCEL